MASRIGREVEFVARMAHVAKRAVPVAQIAPDAKPNLKLKPEADVVTKNDKFKSEVLSKISQLIDLLSKPKRVVRDANGRIIGIERG